MMIDAPTSTRPAPTAAILTGREREILQLIADGLRTKDIAARLIISTKTVDTHRQNIMKKTGIDSIALLTKFAIVNGITTLGD